MTPDRFVHYTLGINWMDNDHDILFQEMDELIRVLKNDDVESVQHKLDILLSTLIDHANNENTFMDDIRYPYSLPHKNAHRSLIESVSTIVETLTSRQPGTHSYALIDRLEEIFIHHVDDYDRQVAEYFRKQSNIAVNTDSQLTA
jgi:hemerythrin-like metal-binding protein